MTSKHKVLLINIIGSVVLIDWLVFDDLAIPVNEAVIVWIVGVLVLLIGIAELVTKSWIYET